MPLLLKKYREVGGNLLLRGIYGGFRLPNDRLMKGYAKLIPFY